YSSLAYLTRFPFDPIKVDRSFLDDQSKKGAMLLKSMISMAHELGLSVVAEGVTGEREVEELRATGCEYAQSFHFGTPVDAEASLRILMDQYPLKTVP